jgi:hypothetical protein
MVKIVDKGLMTKNDPGYSPGFIVGPVVVSRRSTKSGNKGSSQEAPAEPEKKKKC